jgi:TfoX/Sxy family transcriptional regulator of competence genes
MASRESIVTYIVDQCGEGVSARKLFGEYGLYCDGVLFALVCDDQLFVKATEEGRTFLGEADLAPPYPGAKPAFVIAPERWDDREWMSETVRITLGALQGTARRSQRRKGVTGTST